MIFICISLIICDVEHLFMCVRAILIYLWKNFPFSSSTYFKTYCFFLLLSCAGSLYSLDISPLSDIWFVKIFPHSVGCLFILLFLLLCQSFWTSCSPICWYLLLLFVKSKHFQKLHNISFFFFFFKVAIHWEAIF